MTSMTAMATLKPAQGRYWSLVDQMVVSGGGVVTTVIVARAVGTSGLGAYAVIVAVVLLAQAIQHGLCVTSVMSLPPRADGDIDAERAIDMVQARLLVLLTCAAFPLLALLLTRTHAREAVPTAAIGAALVAATLQREYVRRRHYVARSAVRALRVDGVAFASSLAALLALVAAVNGPSVLQLLAVQAAGHVMALGLELARGWPCAAHCRRLPSDRWPEIRRFGGWQVASGVLSWCMGGGVLIVISGLASAATAGGVRAAQSLAGIIAVGSLSLENWLPRQTAALFSTGGRSAVKQWLPRRVIVVLAALTPCAGLVMAFAEELMRWVYGPAYGAYAPLLIGLMTGAIISFGGTYLQSALRAFGATHLIFVSNATAAALALLTVSLMANRDSLLGLSAALAVGPTTAAGLYALSVWRSR